MERPDCVRAASLDATQTRACFLARSRALVLSPHDDALPSPRGNVQINAKYRRVYSLRSARKREREREGKRNATGPLSSLSALSFMRSQRCSTIPKRTRYSAVGFRPWHPSLASRVACKISQNLAKSRTLHASTALVASFSIVRDHQCLAQKRPRRASARTHVSNAHASFGEKIERKIHCVLPEILFLVG